MSNYTSFGNIGIPGSSSMSDMMRREILASAQQDAADRAVERRIVEAATDNMRGPSPVAIIATVGAGALVLWLLLKK
jgi:hypothetical protein